MKKFSLIILGAGLFLTSCGSTSKGTTTTNPVAANTTVTAPTANAENIAEGKMIFENNCGKCHDLPNPTAFSDEKWVGIMNWMAPKAKITDEQKAFAYLYVSNSN